MALVSVPFPTSAAPGQYAGEGTGDLVNVYAEKNGQELSWKRVPGLGLVNTLTGYLSPRGFLYTGTTLYGAFAGKLVTISSAGVVTAIGGTLAGAERVTMAVNDRSPTPSLVVVSDTGAYALSGATLISYPDSDVGAPNSVSTFHNYFMFTYSDSRIVASDLNADATSATSINPLSVASAKELPDGLLRGVTLGSNWLAFGDASTQFWQDVGASPFPLALAHTMPVGLFGRWAVTGYEYGWDRELYFVASDGTVRRLNGYEATIVSTPDVAADINKMRFTPELLRLNCYTFGDNAIVSMSSPTWTWEFNATTETWHKRKSFGMTRWIGSETVKAFGRWWAGSYTDERLFEINTDYLEEDTSPLVATAYSGSVKDFAKGIRVPSAFFDFTVGVGSEVGDPDATDPHVLLSWSHDGGATWANPLARSLGKQGESGKRLEIGPLGRSTHHGIRMKWEISDPVRVTFRGAVIPGAKPRNPAKDE